MFYCRSRSFPVYLERLEEHEHDEERGDVQCEVPGYAVEHNLAAVDLVERRLPACPAVTVGLEVGEEELQRDEEQGRRDAEAKARVVAEREGRSAAAGDQEVLTAHLQSGRGPPQHVRAVPV